MPQASRGGRPRDENLERRILAAVTAVLAECGYEGVTFEEVARRSGAAKATLYRRWKSKREMVIAALKAGPPLRRLVDHATRPTRSTPAAFAVT